MSLDQNLFTLHFTPSKEDPSITDLVDPSNNAHYRKVRVQGSVYTINVYDPLSQSLLASATAPSATSKHKTIELYNPSHAVELKFSGTLTWKWRFQWEEHEFEWKREECFIIRKPDPAVLVAVTKEPSGRLKTSSVQILDYNLNRFDIQDRKGLELVILTALLTFQDTNDAYHTRDEPSNDTPSDSQTATPPLPAPSGPLSSFFGVSRRTSETRLDPPQGKPPPLPPKPEQRTGIERIAELHALRNAQGEGEANEVHVSEEGNVDDYALYAEKLLNDDAMLFVTVRSSSAAEVPKVLQVVEQAKRLRHKAGLDEDEALHQYVIYDTPKTKGPRRINLDDPSTGASKPYAPPTNLTVHLSKIDMPELQPKPERRPERLPSRPPLPAMNTGNRSSEKNTMFGRTKPEPTREKEKEREKDKGKDKERERERAREQEKARKKAEKEAKKLEKHKKGSAQPSSSSSARPPPTKGPTRPAVPLISTIPAPPNGAYAPYQPPLPSFPQPSSPYQAASPYYPPVAPYFPEARPSSYYNGGNFSPVGQPPPPVHPTMSNRPRPASVHAGSSWSNAGGFNPSYLRQ